MITRYKLTTQSLTTHGCCEWKLNKWKKRNGKGFLCSKGWLHCYTDPVLALLLNPIHAAILEPRLWEVEVDGLSKEDAGLKEGWTRMRLLREIPLPTVTETHSVAFGILCAKKVCFAVNWVSWADDWLSGHRPRHYRYEITEAVMAAKADANSIRLPEKAAWAARAAAEMLSMERWDDEGGWAAMAAEEWAARAAESAARCGSRLDLIAISRQACKGTAE